ncbi:hypothetical protein RJT34_08634 [Clitoria ternatea]|uniref:Uncharacterized protein n=1 Tax=Clitoria ternatea TaxID=43366 RepID=A0AAN9PSW3_CLITE
MKSDEVRGGIKVFNAEQSTQENVGVGSKFKQSPIGSCANNSGGKRKTWKLESSEKNLEISSRGKVGAFADKFERSPTFHARKLRSESHKGGAAESCEGHEKVQLRKTKSDSIKKNASSFGSISGTSIQLRKTKSERDRVSDDCGRVEVENLKNGVADENCTDCDDDVCLQKVNLLNTYENVVQFQRQQTFHKQQASCRV